MNFDKIIEKNQTINTQIRENKMYMVYLFGILFRLAQARKNKQEVSKL